MLEKWTGELIGEMHNHGIKQRELAEEMGITNAYAGMILRGERKPPNIQVRMQEALQNLISKRG